MKNVIQVIPEVHSGNDSQYWKEEFPKIYSHRTLTKLEWIGVDDEHPVELCADGDVHEEIAGGYHKLVCSCCHGSSKFKPIVIGNEDVGFELVYMCTNCKHGLHRIYSLDKDIEEYLNIVGEDVLVVRPVAERQLIKHKAL